MAKLFVYCDSLASFKEKKVSANEDNTLCIDFDNNTTISNTPDILWNHICFIEDTKQIWTHGNYYNSGNNGGIELSDITFLCKSTLTNCTQSNTSTEVTYGDKYENIISVTSNYEIKSISVIMGGVDITGSSWNSSSKTITIDKVTGNIFISGTITNGYSITYVLPNASSTNTDTGVEENTQYTTKITSNEGYNLTSVTVTMGGSDITSTVYSNGTITISSVTSDVVITVVTTQITFTVTQGTSDGVTCTAPSIIGYGDTLEITVEILDNYIVGLDNITVTEAGIIKTFSYANDKISILNVKGNVVYSIDAAATYTVTYVFNNVTSSNTTSIADDQNAYETTLSYDEDTFNGIDITVTMGENDITNSVYDKTTHIITIANPSGNITIHAEAITTIEKDLFDKIDLMSLSWKFNKLRDVSSGSFTSTMLASSYDDSSWDTISLPYDWSIYNSFNTSTTGNEYESGWLSGGDAIYRTTVTIPSDYSGNKVYIHFDGVYMETEVFINGTSVGTNKNGYIPFSFDITDSITFGASNTIAVAVSSHVPNSRWYSGAGIYRDCWITCNNVPEIDTEYIVVTTPNLATENGGTVTTNIKAAIVNNTSSNINITEVNGYVYQEWDGTQVGLGQLTSQTLMASTTTNFTVEAGVSAPTLWTTYDNTDTPRLYIAKIAIKYTIDDQDYLVWSPEIIFGYRYISYDSTSFYLNGTKTFLKGICNHHDNGPLGSETYYDASERQLRILKGLGTNCLRTAHNPQSKTFLECAMRMGFMVIEELFDGWRYVKNSNTYDYARFFSADNSYIEVVVKNIIKRDINNPAIIMWSIGNEVDEGCNTSYNSQYVTDCTTINTYVKNYDTTRPTTFGNNKPANSYAMQCMSIVDICGVNYGDDSEYSTLRSASSNGTSFSNKCIYGSETTSPFYTRGIYENATGSYYYSCFDYSNSEVSNSHASWGDSSAVALKRHSETYTWMAGIMPWTGYDYIGEPTPANSTGVRSSFFGVIDLCGFTKDAYYMYQSKWTSDPMIHIVPEDWTIWQEGSTVTVWVYSNCNSVKLHLNGTEISVTTSLSSSSHYAYEYSVTYAIGTLVATGYDASGNIVAQDVRYSAATKNKISLYSDKTQVDKTGLLYVECNIEDKYGTIVPRSSDSITFTATGGTITATDNGFEGCFEDMRNSVQSCFTGKCIAIIKPDGISDSITVTATASDLTTGTITIPQGDSNIYKEETTQTFMDPTNPTIHSSVSAIELSTYSVHISNGGNTTVTVTKTPSASAEQITATSLCEGITATANNTNNTVTITNTVNNVKGNVLIECGGIEKYVQVACGTASVTTCALSINGTTYSTSNNTLYIYEYLPITITTTGSDVATIESSNTTIFTIDTDNNVMFGKSEGSADIVVTLEDASVFTYTIAVETWESSSTTITVGGIKSVNSSYYLPTVTGYTTSTNFSGDIKILATDSTATKVTAIIDMPTSTTVTSTLTEFGTDSTGTRKAYIINYSGTAGSDLTNTLAFTDSENGLHVINVRDGKASFKYSYKVGTLSCTSLTVSPTVINITSDDTNNQSITYTVLPAETTDDLTFESANNYVTIVGGSLFAIANGTDTITVTCGSQTKTVTVNISNITEDSTILAYNAEITGTSQYYAGGSSGISWDNTYTLYAELKITDMSVSTANIISFGQSINAWGGCHYHIYYPATSNSTTIGNFTDTTTKGICIAMSSSGSPTTCGVTGVMQGSYVLDTIYLVQNNNGLWINGTEATNISKTSGAFATIQALTTVQIGSCEGSGRFTGIIKQLRRIKTTDLATAYQDTGLTSTELEDISTNGLNTSKYLAIYEAAASNSSSDTSINTNSELTASPITLDDIESMSDGDISNVLLVNPQNSNGYILGYTTQTAGYSNSTVSITSGSGFTDVSTMTTQVNSILNDTSNSQYFTFIMTKTGTDTCTLKLSSGYGPTGDTSTVSWSTTLLEYTISDLSSAALSSSSSMCTNYSEDNCLRLANPSGYYLNAQGTPASLTFATGTGEWSVWYIYKVNS